MRPEGQGIKPLARYARNKKVIINVNPSTIYDMTSKDSLLCYSGKYIKSPSFINKDSWGSNSSFGSSHKLYLTIPLKGVNKITGTKAIVGEKEIVLPNKKEGEIYYGEYRVNLIKGLGEELLYVVLSDPALDYRQNIKIIVEYE